MQLTRERKEQLVDEMAEKMDEYPVVGVLDMHSLPAKQLQEIKKELAGEADIQMSRKTLISLALEQSSQEHIADLEENDAIMPALIFTEKNPFSLYKLIQEKKTAAAASGGEVAPNDIVLEEGKTELDPGPMLGRIQGLGAQTEVQDGKIAITSEAVAVAAGEVIDNETAEILNKLGMKPLEVGLDLKLVYEDGEIFGKDVLAIDAEEYRSDLESAAAGAFNLAVNAGVMNESTAEPVVRQAFSKARNLAINAGVVVDEVVEDLLRKGRSEADALDAAVDLESVELEEDGEEEEESESAEEAEDEAEPADEQDAVDEAPEEDEEDADETDASDDDEAEDAEDIDETTDKEDGGDS